MRCPADASKPWKQNGCLFVDRSQIPYFGYTIRTKDWRYTEWCRWNGVSLEPDWSSPMGNELYTHQGDDGFNFNLFENVNQNETHPDVVLSMRAMLRAVVANQTRLWR